jgi:hypothetical protein
VHLARIYLVDGHLTFSFYLLSVCHSGRRLDPAKIKLMKKIRVFSEKGEMPTHDFVTRLFMYIQVGAQLL